MLIEGFSYKNMKPMNTPPEDLSADAQKIWRDILREYEIHDAAGLQILRTGLEAWDRAREAREIIDREGLMLRDRFGQMRINPLCTVERDARSQWLLALRHLNLDLEPLRDRPGRPGGGTIRQTVIDFTG